MLKSDNASDVLPGLIREQLLILDGAMGSMIQRLKLDEAAVREKGLPAITRIWCDFPTY